ncbi:MAG: HD domain-containing protein, partial [Acidobacteriota bacterium]|nr:HD domain-containing protein [Acidobacteriota bacterium]
VEDDMRRRDFTVNAMARRLADGALVDPLRGRQDLRLRLLRTVSPTSFAEDPLRLVRGLRFVSQLGFELEAGTLEHMRTEAAAVTRVSGERIADELAKLLLGARPRDALVVARDTGVLVELIPEFGPAVHLSDHIFAVVQETADAGDELAVRLAALFHDVGKPVDGDPIGHARVAAGIAHATMERLRFPARLTRRVVAIVRDHPYRAEDRPKTPREARRFLDAHADELAFDLVAHRIADLRAKDRDAGGLEELRGLLEQELSSPHHLRNLAVDGNDLIALGFRPGPELGSALRDLLEYVVDHPESNTRDELVNRARAMLNG